MSNGHDNEPPLDDVEAALAERLDAQRPVPGPRFRGALGRYLAVEDPGYGPRPRYLRVIVMAFCASGSVLIALGALTAVGIR